MQAPDSSVRSRWESAHELRRFRPAYPHEQVVRWTFRQLNPGSTPPQRVLDLGCGAGRHSLFLAREGFDVIASDLSATGLRALEAQATAQGLSIRTHRTEAHDLGFLEDGSIDAVLCFGVLYYLTWNDAVRAIQETARILRPGGKLFLVTRTDADSRRKHAEQVGPATWRIHALEAAAASDIEAGLEMLFLSREQVQGLLGAFNEVCIDRMSYVHEGFVDDDWVVTASKPAI